MDTVPVELLDSNSLSNCDRGVSLVTFLLSLLD